MSNHEKAPGLSYRLPKPEKVHTALRIPGSHTLYMGPHSCMRRHAIHAIEYGDRRDVSFLFVTEADVVSGRYEDLVSLAVADLLTVLQPEPHIFFIAVFCIDDFLGTDESVMLQDLHKRFPGKRFVVEHIDPVTLDKDRTMGKRKHIKMYAFLEPADRPDKGINFVGNFVSLEPECEFPGLLQKWGAWPVRELFTCSTYEQYQDMAKSCLTVVLRMMGEASARYMKDKLGIPYYIFPTSYSAKYIAKGYEDIAGMLGYRNEDFSSQVEAAVQDAEKTAKYLAGLPIALDASAFLTPFTTALALLEYGFAVQYVFRKRDLFDIEVDAHKRLLENYPGVKIVWTDDYKNFQTVPGDSDCMAIGADARRVLQARYFVDIWHDEGFFGFQGIHKLMALLRGTVKREKEYCAELPQGRG